MQRWMILGATLAMAATAGCRPANEAQVRQQVQGVRQELDNAADNARRATAEANLAGSVKSALSSRKGLDARSIDVEAHGAQVILKGDVASPEQATLAEKIAAETQGVQQVENRLTMRIPAKSAAPANPAGAPAAGSVTPMPNTATPSSGTTGAASSDGSSAPLATPQPTVTH